MTASGFFAVLSAFALGVGVSAPPAEAWTGWIGYTQPAPSGNYWSTQQLYNSAGSNLTRGSYLYYSGPHLGYFTVQFYDQGRQRWYTVQRRFNTSSGWQVFSNYWTGGTSLPNAAFSPVSSIQTSGAPVGGTGNQEWRITIEYDIPVPGGS